MSTVLMISLIICYLILAFFIYVIKSSPQLFYSGGAGQSVSSEQKREALAWAFLWPLYPVYTLGYSAYSTMTAPSAEEWKRKQDEESARYNAEIAAANARWEARVKAEESAAK